MPDDQIRREATTGMGDDAMRHYLPDYTRYGISRRRYEELRGFCLQYPEWKAIASSLLGVGAQGYSDMPHGTEVSDPTARLVEKREAVVRKIELVERVARMVGGGRWYAALIQHCCMGMAWDHIDPLLMPTSRRNDFYKRRREFFILLDAAIDTPGAIFPR